MPETAQSPEPEPPNIPMPEGNTDGFTSQGETNRPASIDELKALAKGGIGSLAPEPPESRPENHPDDPPEAGNSEASPEPPGTGESEEFGGPGGETTKPVEKIRRSSSRGQEKELPPPGSPPPKPKAPRESRRGTPPAEVASATPPVEPEETAGRIITDQIIETPTKDRSWTPEAAIKSLEEERQRVREEAERDMARIDKEAQTHQPPTAEKTSPASPTEGVTPEQASPPKAAESPKPVSNLNRQVEERFSDVKTGTVLSAGGKSWRIGKIEEVEIAGHPVKLYWTKRADGTAFSFSESDVKELIRDNLLEKHKAAEIKEAAKIKAEAEKQQEAERAAKEAAEAAKAQQKEALETRKMQQAETFPQRLKERLEALQQPEAKLELERGKQTLTFEKYDPSVSNPYKFKDEKGQTFNLTEKEVEKILAEKVRAEDKAVLESLKPTREKEKLTATEKKETRGPEKPTPKWKEKVESAKSASPVVNGLYSFTNRFLSNFDWRDKEKYSYAAGIIVGAGTNIGLTFLTPGVGIFAARVVRSAVYTGVLRFASVGLNAFRHGAVEKILKDPNGLNIQNAAERKAIVRQSDEAYRLLRSGDVEGYNNAMRELAKAVFLKYGRAEIRADIESQVSQEAMKEFLAKVESLNTKYQNLNNQIRSFAAGLTVGSVGSSLGFGFFEGFKSIFERIQGGHHAPPTGIEHGPPTHGPPTAEATAAPTPTPTPTEIPGHITPHIPTEAPPSVSPQAWEVFQHLPADQQERLTEIAADPAKLDAFNHWIATHEAVPHEVPDISDILANPDLSRSLEIHPGDTVGQIFVDSGHEITWGADNADLFGTHLYVNYDMLKQMHDSIASVGIAVEAFPAREELASLIRAAGAGDPVAIHRLTEALHWVPAGGKFNLLTPEGIAAAKRALGLAG